MLSLAEERENRLKARRTDQHHVQFASGVFLAGQPENLPLAKASP